MGDGGSDRAFLIPGKSRLRISPFHGQVGKRRSKWEEMQHMVEQQRMRSGSKLEMQGPRPGAPRQGQDLFLAGVNEERK